MYTFTQINHPPHWWVHKLGLLTVAGVIVLGSGCTKAPSAHHYCPATGIGYDTKSMCESTCQPPTAYTFPSFDREVQVPSQSVKVHIFIGGNGYGKVTAQNQQSTLLCKSKDCGPIEGKISCKREAQCTQAVETGKTFTLLTTEGNFSSFAGWQGDEDCYDGQLTMDTDKYCVAVFQSDETDCIKGSVQGLDYTAQQVRPGFLSPFDEKVFDSRVLTPRRLQALTPAQIAALTLEQLQTLEISQQIQVLTTAQIGALTTHQIQGLTTHQIQGLTTDQIKALSKEQIQALRTEQRDKWGGLIVSSQIGALTTDQISWLTTDQISWLTTAQTGALTTDQIQALTTDQIKALSTTQIGALSTAQIGELSTAQKAALDARKKALYIE